jgi:hypothetical protein
VNPSRVWILGENFSVTPGFYRVRLVRNGPLVSCRCWIEPSERDPETDEPTTDERTRLVIDGREERPFYPPFTTLVGEPITEAEFKYLAAMSHWARTNDASRPEAFPSEPIDLSKVPSPF